MIKNAMGSLIDITTSFKSANTLFVIPLLLYAHLEIFYDGIFIDTLSSTGLLDLW